MQLTFLGAAGTVTGSRYLIEADGKKILVDCGMFQGYKELRDRNWQTFPLPASEIDAVVLTHAHLDHSGYLPLLVKQGFRGRIYCSQPTFDLCKLLLPDSGFIQEEDARRANKYGYSKHSPALPLYTLAEAQDSLNYFSPVTFGKDINIADALSFRLERAGHILGASWTVITAEKRTLLFSGDLGRPHDPVMKAPVAPISPDFLIVESTYGNLLHQGVDPIDQLEGIINRTAARGGSIIVPAFAVGRAQNLMYYIHTLKESLRIPNLPVYLDSPMAINATDIMERNANEHRLSDAACQAMTKDVTYIHSSEESKRLDQSQFPKIILAASGMATGGRILHHIKNLGGDHRNTIVFTGFQAGGTMGNRIVRGERDVKIHGEMVHLSAEVTQLHSVSAHADYSEILNWLGHIRKPPHMTFIVHGEPSASQAFQATLREVHPTWETEIPEHQQSFSL